MNTNKGRTELCKEEGVLYLNGEIIPLNDLTWVSIKYLKRYYDRHDDYLADCGTNITVGPDGKIDEEGIDLPTIYDWDYTKNVTTISVKYIKDGKSKWSSAELVGYVDWPRQILHCVPISKTAEKKETKTCLFRRFLRLFSRKH